MVNNWFLVTIKEVALFHRALSDHRRLALPVLNSNIVKKLLASADVDPARSDVTD